MGAASPTMSPVPPLPTGMHETRLARSAFPSRAACNVARHRGPGGGVRGLPNRLMSDQFRDTREAQPSFDATSHSSSVERLVPLVYEELRRLAHLLLAREAAGHTLTTTDLVHQAYLQLSAHDRTEWRNEAHFMAVAATAIRRILVDHARRHRTARHGGSLRRVPLELANIPVEERADLIVALDEALARLGQLDARQASVVECRFFAGMTEAETAEVLGMSVRTVKRDWMKAKAWLYSEVTDA